MINIIYHSSMYLVHIDGVLKQIQDELYFKFDTGSPSTIIPINRYLGTDISLSNQKELIKALAKERTLQSFKTASGSEMQAIFKTVANVNIGGIILPKFYFYVTLGTTSLTPILGDDFISNCSFVHELKSDIIVNSFDIKGYNKQFINRKSSDIDLLEALSLSVPDIHDCEANYINKLIERATNKRNER